MIIRFLRNYFNHIVCTSVTLSITVHTSLHYTWSELPDWSTQYDTESHLLRFSKHGAVESKLFWSMGVYLSLGSWIFDVCRQKKNMRTGDTSMVKFMRPREKVCVPVCIILHFRELWCWSGTSHFHISICIKILRVLILDSYFSGWDTYFIEKAI